MADDTNKKDNGMNPLDLIGFGSSLINYFGQLGQQNRAFEMNKELASYQNKLNVEQWNRENAYNTPMAMMARYKQAGMNPNLAYGLQNLSANSPQLVGGTPAEQTNSDILNSQTIAQLGLMRAQKENIEADTEDKRSGAGLKDAQKANIGFEQYIKQSMLDLQTRMTDSNIELNEENKKLIEENCKKVAVEVEGIGIDNAIKRINERFLNESYDDRLKQLKLENSKLSADIRLSNAEVNRINTLLGPEIRNLDAELQEINARKDLTQQQKENLAQQKVTDMLQNVYLYQAMEDAKNGKTFKAKRDLITHWFFTIFRGSSGSGNVTIERGSDSVAKSATKKVK